MSAAVEAPAVYRTGFPRRGTTHAVLRFERVTLCGVEGTEPRTYSSSAVTCGACKRVAAARGIEL